MKKRTALTLLGIAATGGVAVAAAGVAGYDPFAPFSATVQTDMSSLLATRSIADSEVIPAPAADLGGVVDQERGFESTAWWPPKLAAPKNGRRTSASC